MFKQIKFLLICVFIYAQITHIDAFVNQKVLLRDIQTLVFENGRMTTGRRVAPIPQMICTSGCSYTPDVIRCVNMGLSGLDPTWECSANGYNLGQVEVNCEGYDYPNDPYVLAGSCGLRYSIRNDSRDSDMLFVFMYLILVLSFVVCFTFACYNIIPYSSPLPLYSSWYIPWYTRPTVIYETRYEAPHVRTNRSAFGNTSRR